MQIYLAPMEGITDNVFRRAHRACFGGVAKYFIPFVNPTQNRTLAPREQRAVDPSENAGMPVVPQLLAKDAQLFVWAARMLADMGYGEVNLNLGCPSGTVTAKGKGAGMLRNPDALRSFLDEIFAQTGVAVSVKTRIGYDSPEEWPVILDVLKDYPMSELIIHPRVRSEFYKGTPHADAFEAAAACVHAPLVYNGDLFDMEDCRAAEARLGGTFRLMIGRGLIANPALAQEYGGGEGLTAGTLRAFHDRLLADYEARMGPNALVRMKVLLEHMGCCFEGVNQPLKAAKKAKNLREYAQAAERIFNEGCLRDVPGYRKG